MKDNLKILVAGLCLFSLGAYKEDEFLNRLPKDAPNPQNFFVDAQSARMAVNAYSSPWTSNLKG